MSNLREKARDIEAAGVAQRGNFTPTGAPKRAYDYWLNNTNSLNGIAIREGYRKENFCHYWRVVVFWSLMTKIKNVAESVAMHPLTLPAVVILTLIGFVYSLLTFPTILEGFVWIMGTILLVVLGAVGLIGGIAMASDEVTVEYNNLLPSKHAARWMSIILPTSILGFLVTKFVNWDHAGTALAFGAVVVLLGLAIIYAATEGVVALLISLALIAGIALAIIAVVVVFFLLGELVISIRASANARITEAHNRALEEGALGAKEDKSPMWIERFFITIGDFLVLLSQIVRVNKWKICPLVEVDTDNRV